MANFLIFLLFCATQVSTLSCTTTGSKRSGADERDTRVVGKDVEPILEDDHLPVRDVLEEGFCYDDIYGEYLRKKYFTEVKTNIRNQKSHENESLFYARTMLLGPMTPYYGSLPIASNHEVEFWMRYFQTRGRNTFLKWLVRAETYREVVEPILKAEGLPKELLYLAMVESGFSNTAHSHKRATGTWQFMSGTAKIYDLKINHWVDERRDPIKASVAAARYLRDLYEQFGDWYLAMAAYNAGPGKIRSAIRRAKTRDFWEISKTRYIRKETKHYVPKVLAALNLTTNAKQNGFDLKQDPEDITPITTVLLANPVQITELAQKLAIPAQNVRKWNPELINDITPPSKSQPYHLRLPESLVDVYEKIKTDLSLIEVTDVLMHKVRPGETLSQIARRYKVRIPQIQSINPNLHPTLLRIGREIAIPVPGIITKKPKTNA